MSVEEVTRERATALGCPGDAQGALFGGAERLLAIRFEPYVARQRSANLF